MVESFVKMIGMTGIISSVVGLSLAGEMRAWTDDRGRKVEAEFVSFDDREGKVILWLGNGDESSFPLAKLSETCQLYVKAQLQAGGADEDSKSNSEGKAAEGEQELNFSSEWPDIVSLDEDPEVEVIKEDEEANEYVYETKNFRFTSDARLSVSVVRNFARLFESTYELCQALPIGVGGGERVNGKYEAYLYEKKESYQRAGARAGSIGVFIPSEKRIVVPFDSLGLRPVGSGYMRDRSSSDSVISHELVHQFTPREYFCQSETNSWFIEGIAEYVATIPYRAGTFNLRRHRRALVDYSTGFSRKYGRGRNIGTDITVPSLEKFMALPYRRFAGNSEANFNYAVGMLLTYYFIHFDGDGDAARLKKFNQALAAGKPYEEAEALLLDGRTYQQLEEDVAKAWSRAGVKFTFGDK